MTPITPEQIEASYLSWVDKYVKRAQKFTEDESFQVLMTIQDQQLYGLFFPVLKVAEPDIHVRCELFDDLTYHVDDDGGACLVCCTVQTKKHAAACAELSDQEQHWNSTYHFFVLFQSTDNLDPVEMLERVTQHSGFGVEYSLTSVDAVTFDWDVLEKCAEFARAETDITDAVEKCGEKMTREILTKCFEDKAQNEKLFLETLKSIDGHIANHYSRGLITYGKKKEK